MFCAWVNVDDTTPNTAPVSSSNGLPLGLAFIGPAWSEARLLQIAIGTCVPLTSAAVAALFWTSARTRVIRWRHVEYEVLGPDEVRVLRRHAPGATA